MTLNINPLLEVLTLEEGLPTYQRDNSHTLIRDGLVLRFVFMYEVTHKITSHTYYEDVALQVVAGIPGFLEEARYLRDPLRQRLAV